ncbi:MAG: DNA polymerase III subunit delta' C-terminal domain-containing protein [Tatlockia sp.]|jgi:DNA polymerase-3 subunit delta'
MDKLWNHFLAVRAKGNLPQALLLVGSHQAALLAIAKRMASAINCTQENAPCLQCKSCHLASQNTHPDIHCLQPDKEGGIIKIEQIRELQTLAFISPKCAAYRIIILSPAEKMNGAAANALLKLLEEPPASVYFLLLAEQISTLPATILSRCQQWRFTDTLRLNQDCLSMGQTHPVDSERGILFSKVPVIIQDLTDLVENKQSVCKLAEKWSSYELSPLLWLIYLIHTQLIEYKLQGPIYEKEWSKPLYAIAKELHVVQLFNQLDTLNEMSKKLMRNISINSTLALENLLLGYVEKNCKV